MDLYNHSHYQSQVANIFLGVSGATDKFEDEHSLNIIRFYTNKLLV